MKEIQRRDFFKKTGLVVGGATAAVSLPVSAQSTDGMVAVEDYTQLRDLEPSLYEIGRLAFISQTGIDGFFVVTEGTEQDNGGTYISSPIWQTQSKHWRRVFDGDVYLSWFTGGGNNIAAIQNAIDFASGEGFWLNINDEHTFTVANTLVPRNNMKIRGAGTLKLAASANQRVFDNGESPVIELENIILRDFHIDGNRSQQTSGARHNDGIRLNFVSDLTIENVTVKSCGTPEGQATANNGAVGISLHECINFEVKACRVRDCQHYNFQFWECVDGEVSANISTDPGSHCFGGAANLRVKYIGNTASIIESRSLFSYSSEIAGQGFWFRQYEDCIIDGNSIHRDTAASFSNPGGAAIQNGYEGSLTDNPQSNRLVGILQPSQSVERTIISNNVITGNFEFGIYSWSGKIEQLNTANNQISGCWFRGIAVTSGRLVSNGDSLFECGNGGENTAALWAAGQNHDIRHVTIRKAGGRGIHLQGVRSSVLAPSIDQYGQKAKEYGIYVNAWSLDPIIESPSVWTDNAASQSLGAIYLGENVARASINGGNLFSQPSNEEAVISNNKTDHHVDNVIGMSLPAGEKYKLPRRSGSDYFWVDQHGNLRMKVNWPPSSDLDGKLIG